jgi:hypothetical protein
MSIRQLIQSTLKQILAHRGMMLAIYLPVLLILLTIGVLSSVIPNMTIPFFLKDVTALGNLPFYAGLISQLGLLFWSATTTICFFTYFSLKAQNRSSRETLNFLLFAAILTCYLTLDDAFLLHEEVFPDYVRFIPEKLVYLGILISVLAFLYFNWQEILRSEYSLLFLAFGFFGLSIALDMIPSSILEGSYLIEKLEFLVEDGAKFAAIITWLTFYSRYGYQQLFPVKQSVQSVKETH